MPLIGKQFNCVPADKEIIQWSWERITQKIIYVVLSYSDDSMLRLLF
jgi:hypothetical protein